MTMNILFLKADVNSKYYYNQISITPIKFKMNVNIDGRKKIFNFITQNINPNN